MTEKTLQDAITKVRLPAFVPATPPPATTPFLLGALAAEMGLACDADWPERVRCGYRFGAARAEKTSEIL